MGWFCLKRCAVCPDFILQNQSVGNHDGLSLDARQFHQHRKRLRHHFCEAETIMPYQYPVPDDYAGATDIRKIAAWLADPSAPVAFCQRMYIKVAGDPVLPLVSGKAFIGPGKWGGWGITSTVDGDLFSSSADITGF